VVVAEKFPKHLKYIMMVIKTINDGISHCQNDSALLQIGSQIFYFSFSVFIMRENDRGTDHSHKEGFVTRKTQVNT
jgi:hypothetical protein